MIVETLLLCAAISLWSIHPEVRMSRPEKMKAAVAAMELESRLELEGVEGLLMSYWSWQLLDVGMEERMQLWLDGSWWWC